MNGPSLDRSTHRLAIAADALTCLRFYTRLPIPALPFEPQIGREPFSVVLRLAPLAGTVVGLVAAAVLCGAAALNLPSLLVAALALLTAVLVTGGLHEDGLADCADGFGGGSTRARKLEIMRDSRLGSYGALAIGFSLLLRMGALSGLLDRAGVAGACAAMIGAAAASRGFGLLPLAALGPARHDGVSHSAGRMPTWAFLTSCGLASVIGIVLPMMAGLGLRAAVLAVLLAAAAAAGTTGLAQRQIGGHTGDVAGAAQQVGEIAFLLGLLATSGFG